MRKWRIKKWEIYFPAFCFSLFEIKNRFGGNLDQTKERDALEYFYIPKPTAPLVFFSEKISEEYI